MAKGHISKIIGTAVSQGSRCQVQDVGRKAFGETPDALVYGMSCTCTCYGIAFLLAMLPFKRTSERDSFWPGAQQWIHLGKMALFSLTASNTKNMNTHWGGKGELPPGGTQPHPVIYVHLKFCFPRNDETAELSWRSGSNMLQIWECLPDNVKMLERVELNSWNAVPTPILPVPLATLPKRHNVEHTYGPVIFLFLRP